jgi:hypothetical protein
MTSTVTLYDDLCTTGGTSGSGTGCALDTDCKSGICDRYQSACGKHCCSHADCSSGQICTIYDLDTTEGVSRKVCAPAPTGTGSKVLGAACTMPSDCASQVCAPTASNMSAMKCSTLCCTDSDCSTIPGGGKCQIFGGPTINNVSTIIGGCVPN